MTKVRLSDIAELVGVSKVTVSKVLSQTSGNNTYVSQETAKRVLDAARQLGYQPNIAARQLAGMNGKLIGVLIAAQSFTSAGEFMRVFYAEQAAFARGYRFIIAQCRPDMKDVATYLDDFSARSVDGIIMHAHTYPLLCRQILELCSRQKNVVYYDKPALEMPGQDYVDIDIGMGVKKLVNHLVASGRRKIVYFLPYQKIEYGKYRVFAERESGFAAAMREHGLDFDADCGSKYLFRLEPEPEEVAALVREIVRNEKPDAIMARNDDIAAIVLQTLLEMGVKCPDDIAVTGYDNHKFAQYLYPSLTTVDCNLALASKNVVDLLIGKIQGDEALLSRRQISIEPDLVVRKST